MSVTFRELLERMAGDPLGAGEIPSVFAPFNSAKAHGGLRFCDSCGEVTALTACRRCRQRGHRNGWCSCGAAFRRVFSGPKPGQPICPRGCGETS